MSLAAANGDRLFTTFVVCVPLVTVMTVPTSAASVCVSVVVTSTGLMDMMLTAVVAKATCGV